jgi:hypothetical protein
MTRGITMLRSIVVGLIPVETVDLREIAVGVRTRSFLDLVRKIAAAVPSGPNLT